MATSTISVECPASVYDSTNLLLLRQEAGKPPSCPFAGVAGHSLFGIEVFDHNHSEVFKLILPTA